MSKPLRLLTVVAAMSATATGALAASDATFLKKAIKGDNSEMTLGKMAQADGASTGVRDFGRMLNEDHAAAKQKTLPVAKAHGVADTEAMAPEAMAEQRKLRGLHGAAFDREFAAYMVKDHKKDISDFEKQAKSGDKATRTLAADTLPTLRKHLETAQSLASAN